MAKKMNRNRTSKTKAAVAGAAATAVVLVSHPVLANESTPQPSSPGSDVELITNQNLPGSEVVVQPPPQTDIPVIPGTPDNGTDAQTEQPVTPPSTEAPVLPEGTDNGTDAQTEQPVTPPSTEAPVLPEGTDNGTDAQTEQPVTPPSTEVPSYNSQPVVSVEQDEENFEELPIVEPSVEEPVVTQEGYTIVSVDQGQPVIQNSDGSTVTVAPHQIRAVINTDNTLTVKSTDGKMVRLPETPAQDNLWLTILGTLMAILGVQLLKNSPKNTITRLSY